MYFDFITIKISAKIIICIIYAVNFKRYFLQFSLMEDLEKNIELKINQISQKLKEIRLSKGYTSYETFAYENELNRVQYWRIESGRNITLKTLIKVLEIHKISLEEFFKDL